MFINFALLFLLIMSGSFFYVCVLNKSAEEAVPITYFALITIFFPFIIINNLFFGYVAVYFFVVLAYLISFAYMIKNKIKFNFKKFLTPGMLTYYILIIILYIVTYKSFVGLWDELRLWGAVPKYMYYSNQSYLASSSAIIPDMQKYPPAMAIIQLLFAKTLGYFSDNILFFAYAIFGASLFIPALKNKDKLSYFFIPFFVALIYIIPQTYYNSLESDSEFYYKTLFIDAFVGLIFAYITYLLLIKKDNSLLSILNITLALISLILIKETGMFFALFLLIAYVFLNFKATIKSKQYLKFLIVLIVPMLFYLLFKFTLKNNGINNTASSINNNNLFGIIFNPTEEQYLYLTDYIYTIFNRNIVNEANITKVLNVEFPFKVPYAIGLNLLFAFFSFFIISKDEIKKYISLNLFVLITTVAYSFGLLLVYIYKIGGGSEFPSFQRYISTMLLAHLTFIFLSSIDNLFNKDNKNQLKSSVFLLFGLFILALLFPVGKANETGYDYFKIEAENLKTDIVKNINNDKKDMDDSSSLFVIMNNNAGEDVLIHHQLFYHLLDSKIYVKNQLGEIDWITEPNIESLKSKFENYDYMFFYCDYENEFFNHYSSMFENSNEIPMMSTYKIIKSSNTIMLKKLGD